LRRWVTDIPNFTLLHQFANIEIKPTLSPYQKLTYWDDIDSAIVADLVENIQSDLNYSGPNISPWSDKHWMLCQILLEYFPKGYGFKGDDYLPREEIWQNLWIILGRPRDGKPALCSQSKPSWVK
jgi:hypothetical protein